MDSDPADDPAAGPLIRPADLGDCIRQRSETARASGALQPLATEVRRVTDAGVHWIVRVAANLDNKRGAGNIGAAGDGRRRQDPFAPPYEPALHVGRISSSHVLLLNKFNVLDNHLLLVTREYVQQEQSLDTADLQAMLLGLAGVDGLAFYNGGAEAGASQHHKHLQLVPLPLGPGEPGLPLAPLLARARFEEDVGRMPDLPMVHALGRMREAWWTDPVAGAESLQALLRQLWLAVERATGRRRQALAYNLLATREWVWLVPRQRESCEGIGVNALGFAGALLVRDEAQYLRLLDMGPMEVLAGTAVRGE